MFECKPEHVAYFDFNTISTVLRNLLTNAIKYSSPEQEIKVVSQKTNNEIIISVIDKGIGINEENLKNLFKIENFKSKPGTHGEKGTGFGLVLCYEFTMLNKGRIWAESTPGKGSTFSFSLNIEQS
ncbi:MAG TPA: ATP-binding protein [Prolixibacteraceae bacterium]|nr:ATP-binding protein [Prolixibacteraceae bacterium]